MNRKEFISKSGAAALVASLGISSVITSCSSDDGAEPNANSGITIDLSVTPFNVLNTEDAWLLHPTEDLLLVNVGGTISIFSSVCPHTACSREWSYNSSSQFVCGCHGSTFTNSGGLVEGPAATGLSRRSFTREGDIIQLS